MQLTNLVRWVWLVALATLAVSGAQKKEPPPVTLSPVTVIERPLTAFVCTVRFRYHVPGAGLKDLVVSSAPKWCAAQGLAVGDRVVAVDGKRIEGQGLVGFIKGSILPKVDAANKRLMHFRLTVLSAADAKPRDIDVMFDEARNFTIKYP